MVVVRVVIAENVRGVTRAVPFAEEFVARLRLNGWVGVDVPGAGPGVLHFRNPKADRVDVARWMVADYPARPALPGGGPAWQAIEVPGR